MEHPSKRFQKTEIKRREYTITISSSSMDDEEIAKIAIEKFLQGLVDERHTTNPVVITVDATEGMRM